MLLCLDVGNTHIYAGLFIDNKLQLQFRYSSSTAATSDQLGVFFKSVLRENSIDAEQIKQIMVCSVVSSLNYSLRSAFLKYFQLEPRFLQNTDLTNLKIDSNNPQEIGADRLSNALAAVAQFPDKDVLIIDLGTATTFDTITRDGVYFSGTIIPGIYISMKALYENTAKLSPVNIVKPQTVVGESTAENIQAGLYYSHLGAAKEITARLTATVFAGKKPFIIGTGGFSYLFEDEQLFDVIIPDLVLQGLYQFSIR